jgi:uncharacterized membrane protein YeaQ/YmgE (transglycosylase-associated protein family)
MKVLMFVVIGALAGWLALLVTKSRGVGFLGTVLVGVLGALLGGFLLGALGFGIHGLPAQALTAFLGSVLLLFLLRLARR